MNSHQHKAIVLMVGLITLCVSYFRTGAVESAVLFNFGIISTVLATMLLAFDHLLWRIRWLYPWFVPVPYVDGKWRASSKIVFPGTTNPMLFDGYVLIEQQFSAIHFRIEWDDGSEMEFHEPEPLAVSGKRTRQCSLGAIYQFKDVNGDRRTRRAVMSFEVSGKLFENRPTKFTVFYSTVDGQHGEIALTKT